MKRALSVLFLLTLNVSLCASNEVDSLLRALDRAIKERPEYSKKKELRIDSLKMQLDKTIDLEARRPIYQKLFKEYRNYNMDSALQIANETDTISKNLHNQEYIYSAQMNKAEILGIMGMYKESLDIINQLNKSKLDKKQLAYYYHLHHSIYLLMAENSFSTEDKKQYEKRISLYKDSLLQTNDPESLGYQQVLTGKLVEQGKYDEALSLMNQCYKEYGTNEALIGTLAYGLSDIYEKKGDDEQQKKHLIISAIADIRIAVKGYIALRKLAILLYKEGDVGRAYTYIKCSLEDAIFCKARFRTLEISEALPIITAAYDAKMKEEKESLITSLCVISILGCILIAAIVYIYIQLKRLSRAREFMKKINDELKQMNESLNVLNKKLSESNLVKEEYIGSVFNLCSTYIDKMENYRISINRKLKSGQIEEASKMTSSTTFVSDEVKEFFRNFDAIFLNIYPNFVDEFNALLLQEEQIIPKTEDILTPELRIFALIRLGINDSSKIAGFLHYSPQTVYNYKLKVRNKLVVSKEEFAAAIQQIGK